MSTARDMALPATGKQLAEDWRRLNAENAFLQRRCAQKDAALDDAIEAVKSFRTSLGAATPGHDQLVLKLTEARQA